MSLPKCSFIVSAYDRPDHLLCCVASLRIQTYRNFEVIVTDNAKHPGIASGQKYLIEDLNLLDDRFSYELLRLRDCYESANWGSRVAAGEYLCFPSDDGYYCPRFLELMLKHGDGADVIYCDCIWDGRGYGPGEECIHLDTAPVCGKIDKGGFLVKRSAFKEFKGPFGMDRGADGWLIEDLVKSRATFKKVGITAWAHN